MKVSIQGVPAYGLTHSDADITVIGGKLFTKVATVARLKRDFMKPDKVPCIYDQQPFTLDGRMQGCPFDAQSPKVATKRGFGD